MPQTTDSPSFTAHTRAAEREWQPLNWALSPAAVARSLAEEADFAWLDSAQTHPGSVSLLAARPTAKLAGHIHKDWHLVEEKAAQSRVTGGLVGWVGYDGLFKLGHFPTLLRYEHDICQWSSLGPEQSWMKKVSQTAKKPTSAVLQPLHFQPQVEKQAYLEAVKKAQAYITAGDIYQVNLSLPWSAAWPEGADILTYYERLRAVSPTPHAALMRLGQTSVLSASPELFLKMQGRDILTRPIKGTRPRYTHDAVRDAQSAEELLQSEKERAELLMITDLERNDLGQVCDYGSVQTPDLWRVEAFPQVYHLVSTVRGTLRPEISHVQAFRACFPGGSISGAPKKRALEIISELEVHPRGLYTGALGYFGFDGSSRWNIAIRTAVQHGAHLHFHAGSGIVADSQPEREWEETHHKASALLRAWAAPGSFS